MECPFTKEDVAILFGEFRRYNRVKRLYVRFNCRVQDSITAMAKEETRKWAKAAIAARRHLRDQRS